VRHFSRRRQEFDTARNHRVPPYSFHHIFPVRPSQTCTTVGAKIPRQCTIENCASHQRRTHFRPQTFYVLFDNKCPTNGPSQHTRKCTPNTKIKR
jgi:hypothetical protein